MKRTLFVLSFLFSMLSFSKAQTYTMPDESEQHEGTWLQWPHQFEYGMAFRNENDATWVAMTNALQANEKVHIIAYNATEQTRITALLTAANVPLTNVNFKVFQTNDVWVRDNGPIYVRNSSGNLVIQDWGFNGWGGDYSFSKCNPIPTSIATATSTTVLNLNSVMTVEGGSFEIDGHGVLLATKSAILSQSNPTSQIKSIRNLGMTESQANAIFTQYVGVTKFYWLEGAFSTDDITDFHIDGFAKFASGNKLVTMNQTDLLYWGVTQSDINTLYGMTNAQNVAYTKVYLPLTQNNVSKTNGTNLGYKGSYCNYYLANNRVLVPNYNDPNDAVANGIIAGLYPTRTVVGIDCRNLYANGGMVHCVTQQQPTATVVPIQLLRFEGKSEQNKVKLTWATASEKNNSHFDIERNTEGGQFETIGKVKGADNTSSKSEYAFVDANTPTDKVSYYRLKQVDFDGHAEYSKILAFNAPKTPPSVKIVPNPAQSDIEILGIVGEHTQVDIYNQVGQLVKTVRGLTVGTKISIADLPQGLYFIKLMNKDQIVPIKLPKFIKN